MEVSFFHQAVSSQVSTMKAEKLHPFHCADSSLVSSGVEILVVKRNVKSIKLVRDWKPKRKKKKEKEQKSKKKEERKNKDGSESKAS